MAQMELASDHNPHCNQMSLRIGSLANADVSFSGACFSFQVFYSGSFCLHGTFLNVVRWINSLLLVQSQARDAEPALNSNGNNPEKMKIFKGE